jgi:hypothetical protein
MQSRLQASNLNNRLWLQYRCGIQTMVSASVLLQITPVGPLATVTTILPVDPAHRHRIQKRLQASNFNNRLKHQCLCDMWTTASASVLLQIVLADILAVAQMILLAAHVSRHRIQQSRQTCSHRLLLQSDMLTMASATVSH